MIKLYDIVVVVVILVIVSIFPKYIGIYFIRDDVHLDRTIETQWEWMSEISKSIFQISKQNYTHCKDKYKNFH